MKSQSFRYCTPNLIGIEDQLNKRVLIKIPLDSESYWQKEYNQNDLIGQIAQDFKADNLIDIPDDYFIDLYFQNKTLKLTDPISSLLNQEIQTTIYINQTLKKKPLKLNLTNAYPELIGKPFNDPFEVYLFSREDKSLKIQVYDNETINQLNLDKFSQSSAYCNGNNHLFISGGEDKNGELIDNFWEIDLKEQFIAEPTKMNPKKNHSMIFVPDKYVFIIGGNDKNCFYFDTENGEIFEWSELNKDRIEPALIRINNFLYCFDNINFGNNEQFSFEKINIDSFKPKWILLYPKIDKIFEGNILINQQGFGVAKDDEDNIIFIGGDIDNNISERFYNYKYDIKDNMIKKTNIFFSNYKLKEKAFLSFKKNVDFILPDFNREHPEVIFYMKNKNRIEAINYQIQPSSIKNNLSDFRYDFNMPKIAVPDPISDFNLEQDMYNINVPNYNDSNLNKKNNSFNSNDINIKNLENNFEINGYDNNNNNNNNDINNIKINEINTNSDNNININNNKIISSFQEPNLEPAKEDLKLSLDFHGNKLKNVENNDDNINNIKINTDIKEVHNELQNETGLNGMNNLNSLKTKNNIIEIRPNLNNINKFEEIDFSKDFNIQGTIFGTKANSKKPDNIDKTKKESNNNLRGPIINNNISNNINNTKVNASSKVITNTQQLSIPDYNISGNIPGIKKFNSNKKVEFTEAKYAKEKKQNVKIKKNQKSNLKNNSNNKIQPEKKDIILSGVIEGVKLDKKINIPNLVGKIPEFNNDNNNNIYNLNFQKDKDNNSANNNLNKNYQSPTFNVDFKESKEENNNIIELNGDNNINNKSNINNYSLSGNIQGFEISNNNNKIDISSFDNTSNFKEIKFEQKYLGKTKININSQVNIKENINNKDNNDNNNINISIDPTKKNFKSNELNFMNNEDNSLVIQGTIPGLQVKTHPFINTQINNSINNNSKNIIHSNNNLLPNGNPNNININMNNNEENEKILKNFNEINMEIPEQHNNIYISSGIPSNNNNININNKIGQKEYILKNINNNNSDFKNNINEIKNEKLPELKNIIQTSNENSENKFIINNKINSYYNQNNNIKLENNIIKESINSNYVLNNDNNIIIKKENVIYNKNTKTKNKNLPLVGSKNYIFQSSKVEPIGNLNIENIDINNIKSSKIGINGSKIGGKIIE